jgi:hypothetical protein
MLEKEKKKFVLVFFYNNNKKKHPHILSLSLLFSALLCLSLENEALYGFCSCTLYSKGLSYDSLSTI